jgi:hypothetical protein
MDKRKLHNDLTKMFCINLYHQETVSELTSVAAYYGLEDRAIHRYQNDALFHAKVDSLVFHVMLIVGNRDSERIADLRAQLAELAQCRDHWKASYEDVRADLKRAEEERDDRRMSLAQEIAGALKARGLYCPKDFNSPDIIQAVGLALESLSEHRLNFSLAREAEKRGEEMFLDAHPEYRDRLALPSTDRLVCWLLEQLVAAKRIAAFSPPEGWEMETCKSCGQANKIGFDIPDSEWEAIVPIELQDRIVCYSCLEQMAFDKGLSIHLNGLFPVARTDAYYQPEVEFEKQLTAAQARAERAEKVLALLDAVKADAKSVANAPPGEFVRGLAFSARQVCKQVVEAVRLANATESVTSEPDYY